jgi:Putative bacterial sensory transduction regulator
MPLNIGGNFMHKVILTCLTMVLSPPSWAVDKDSCKADMVCASKPETIVAALQDAGYKAKLSKSETTGNPTIASSTSGYDFDVFFYGCKDNAQCDSVQFLVSFEKDKTNTAELANKWNSEKRFSQAYINKDGEFVMGYDVTTLGGLSKNNFADVIDWWTTMMGELRVFFKTSSKT